MKTNILVVGICDKVVENVARKLAVDFDLYYADVSDIIAYNIANEDEVENICGIDYLKRLKLKCVRDICLYENTLITMPVSLFINEDYLVKFKKSASAIVFVDFSVKSIEKYYSTIEKLSDNEQKVNMVSRKVRRDICLDHCDVNIKIDTLNERMVYKKVKRSIENYLS